MKTPNIVKRIWGADTVWLDGKSRLEEMGVLVGFFYTERMYAGRESCILHVDGAETEQNGEEKLLVTPGGLARRT